MPYAPLTPPWKVTPHGGFSLDPDFRTDPKLCYGGAPCSHGGVDLAGKAGRVVGAPEDGEIVYAVVGNKIRPFSGFGPACMVIKGTETGYYHLLGHLSPDMLVEPSQEYTDNPLAITQDPLPQDERGKAIKIPVIARATGDYDVKATDPIGAIGVNHVHWEVRSKPTDKNTRMNPLDWLDQYAKTSAPAGKLPSSQFASTDDDGGWIWLAALGLWMWTRRKRR